MLRIKRCCAWTCCSTAVRCSLLALSLLPTPYSLLAVRTACLLRGPRSGLGSCSPSPLQIQPRSPPPTSPREQVIQVSQVIQALRHLNLIYLSIICTNSSILLKYMDSRFREVAPPSGDIIHTLLSQTQLKLIPGKRTGGERSGRRANGNGEREDVRGQVLCSLRFFRPVPRRKRLMH